jgi:hypothetical protein
LPAQQSAQQCVYRDIHCESSYTVYGYPQWITKVNLYVCVRCMRVRVRVTTNIIFGTKVPPSPGSQRSQILRSGPAAAAAAAARGQGRPRLPAPAGTQSIYRTSTRNRNPSSINWHFSTDISQSGRLPCVQWCGMCAEPLPPQRGTPKRGALRRPHAIPDWRSAAVGAHGKSN